MPITVRYNPSFIEGGQLAHAAGRGRFLQDKDKFDYQRLDADRRFGLDEEKLAQQQSQFDASLEQRGSEFDRSLQNRVNEQALRDRQYNQGLAFKDYADRRALSQRGYEFDEITKQKQAELGFRERATGQEMDLRQQALRAGQRKEILAIKQRKEDQRFDLSLTARENLEKKYARGDITEEQYMQARGQFVQQFGDLPQYAGQYPDAANENPLEDFDNEAIVTRAIEQGGMDPEGNPIFTEARINEYMEEDDNGKLGWKKNQRGDEIGWDAFRQDRDTLQGRFFTQQQTEEKAAAAERIEQIRSGVKLEAANERERFEKFKYERTQWQNTVDAKTQYRNDRIKKWSDPQKDNNINTGYKLLEFEDRMKRVEEDMKIYDMLNPIGERPVWNGKQGEVTSNAPEDGVEIQGWTDSDGKNYWTNQVDMTTNDFVTASQNSTLPKGEVVFLSDKGIYIYINEHGNGFKVDAIRVNR